MTIWLVLVDAVAANIVNESIAGGLGVCMIMRVVPVEVTADIDVVLGGISCVAGKVVIPSAIVKETVFRTQQSASNQSQSHSHYSKRSARPG